MARLRVLVTRPSPAGEALCAALKAERHEPFFFPAMEIKPLSDPGFEKALRTLDRYAFAIFVSRHAVRHSQVAIHKVWQPFPATTQMLAVGEGTAEALKEAGLPQALCPKQWSSEGLLDLPELQTIDEKKIAIFCGQGGRERLAQTLKARGAEVLSFPCYQRLLPTQDVTPLEQNLQKQEVDAVIGTSVQLLHQLKALVSEKAWPFLRKIPLVLISERIMIQAKALGFETCVLAPNASHEGILQALKNMR